SVFVLVQNIPSVYVGADTLICDNAILQLEPEISLYDHIYWTTNGDGYFEDPDVENTVYIPGDNDIANGSVQLTIEAFALSPCSYNVTDKIVVTLDPCTGIDQIGISPETNIVPNPNNGLFTIKMKYFDKSDIQLSIVDIQGKEVFEKILESKTKIEESLNLQGLPMGTYYLKIIGDKFTRIEKLIIK
ncbi:MAG: T9SS type A sorting domain-containing protein, partial [Candidatus Heimdallarchaeota archaeon]|nr:T9SS type A sorting domain-containing protein [Candidatus Heimdallarchaeota archaeon]